MKLEIKSPCPENWAGMTPDASGRYCSNCAKSVHDFTDKPKEELLAFLLCSTQSPCVRMLASQQHFTAGEVEQTAQKLVRSGKTIPAATLALVMLLATGCATDAPPPPGARTALTTTDSAAPRSPFPGTASTDLPEICLPPDTGLPAIMPRRIAVPPTEPDEPVLLGEPVFDGGPTPGLHDTTFMGDIEIVPAE